MPSRPPHAVDLFCIVALPRSGTTWLVDLLDHHPRVRCTADILRRNPFREGIPAPTADPTIVRQGFKILGWQNTWWLQELAAHPEVPVILQWRRNPIRHLYSLHAANRSGIYHGKPTTQQLLDRFRHGWQAMTVGEWRYVRFALRTIARMLLATLRREPLYRPQPLPITPDELDRFVESTATRLTELRRMLAARGGPWMEVTYEDLAGPDHEATLTAIQVFLGVDPMPLTTDVVKLNDRPLHDMLANYEELREHCVQRGIPFE